MLIFTEPFHYKNILWQKKGQWEASVIQLYNIWTAAHPSSALVKATSVCVCAKVLSPSKQAPISKLLVMPTRTHEQTPT